MKQYIKTLAFILYFSATGCLLFGWNNQCWLGNGDRVSVWNGPESADYLRLGVLKDGVYRVSAFDIATALGVSTNSVFADLGSGDFSLTCSSNSVAWTTDGTNLYFYGEATDELYAPENVYFLRPQSGAIMSSQAAPPDPVGATNTWFMQYNSYRSSILDVDIYYDRRSSNASITDALVFGEWLEAVSAGDDDKECLLTPALPGFVPGPLTNLEVTVHAISYGDYGYADDNHSLGVSVNDVLQGSFDWSGEQKVVFSASVPCSAVTAGVSRVSVQNLNTSGYQKHALLLDVGIEYPRSYEVMDAPLFCTGGGAPNILVSGSYTNASVVVWDISDPLNALSLDVQVSMESNGWSTVFACSDVSSRYAVFDAADCFEPSVAGFRDVDWNAAGAIPSLVIVTPPRRWISGFEDALRPLVLLRRAQGLGVRVVDAEDIYNAFSNGLVTPLAFQNFAKTGVTSGSGKLRYMLFAGYASTDYKLEVFYPDTVFANGKKGSPALFPLMQVSQVEPDEDSMLLLPNDLMLGDIDDNGIPEVAVGRFLATDASELSNMVAKTLTHDLKHPWNRGIIVSDWNNVGDMYFNFSSVCSQLNSDFSQAGWNTDYYYCATDTGFASVWENMYYGTGVRYDLNAGRDFFYYLGHSSDTLMGHAGSFGKYLLDNSRLSSADWPYAPIAFCMGCRMGRYTMLDINCVWTCIMEAAVRNPTSGFSAVISSAGYMDYGDAKALSELVSDEINLFGAKRIGDALTAALDQMGAGGVADMQHLVFLGDPSMPVYKPRYPTIIKLR